MVKQMSRCVDDIRRLWKIIECCKRVRGCRKISLIIYPDSWEYWYAI